MATKPGRVVTYNKELPSIKSRPFYHVVYLLILISLIQFVGLKRKRLSRHRLLVLSSTQLFGNIGAKKYFRDHRTANLIQLFVTMKGNFSGLFFF